jgi:hypothetical protein
MNVSFADSICDRQGGSDLAPRIRAFAGFSLGRALGTALLWIWPTEPAVRLGLAGPFSVFVRGARTAYSLGSGCFLAMSGTPRFQFAKAME